MSVPMQHRESRDSMLSEHSDDLDDHSEYGDLLLQEWKTPVQQARLGTLQLLMLTCPALGIQIMWLLMMSYGTPYLTSLGLSNSLTALVWLAGPLAGAIAQPIFGALSDQCRHSWGRRKPFIFGGSILVILCLLLLACTPNLVNSLTRHDSRKSDDHWVQIVVQACSVLLVYGINIAMQPLQCGTRALIVDICPAHQQAQASAWWSRLSGIGSVSIYLLGFTAVSNWAHYLAGSEFKALSIFGTILLILTIIPSLMIHEKPLPRKVDYRDSNTARSIVNGLAHSLRTLPRTTWKVCKIQFFAWLAWFPILYYTTTYIIQIFAISKHIHLDASKLSHSDGELMEVAKRRSILACFCFALVALATNLLLPLFERQSTIHSVDAAKRNRADYGLSAPRTTIFTIPISRLWQISHILFAVCVFFTFFAYTVPAATVLVGVMGMSWAVAMWAPYALIGTEISYSKLQRSSDGYLGPPDFVDDECWPAQNGTAAIMGIHNMAIATPQVLAALICSGVFKLTEVMGVEDGAAWVFRIAGCAAVTAAWMTGDLET